MTVVYALETNKSLFVSVNATIDSRELGPEI